MGPAESPQLLGLARQLLVDNGFDFDAVLAQGRLAVDVTDHVIHAGGDERPRLRFC